MYKSKNILFLYTETPLHAGSGTSLSIVDLPIQREKHTNFPIVQGSSLKGALREAAERIKNDDKIKIVFGPETDKAEEHAGALSFTDARLLLFPVRSLKGIFAYCTSQSLLRRFKRDVEIVNPNFKWKLQKDGSSEEIDCDPGKIVLVENRVLVTSKELILDGTDKIILEEFEFDVVENSALKNFSQWLSQSGVPQDQNYNYWKEKISNSLVVLPEDDFRGFTSYSTEVIARIVLNDNTKTTDNLWYEENLPGDSMLYSLILATNPLIDENNLPPDLKDSDLVLSYLKNLNIDRFQMGGNETVGRGIVKMHFLELKENQKIGGTDNE